ncbi:hypothetical protein N7532_008546 [Penicillium argentinense]|uniref:Uncharacterized protein n=1 Tax=Penicillium argentinense TaxID=1131581 RepID=A0A9W9EXL3_9EURO|nr:uncharacterized protein N7532_008546 [Penicillium argentinense]KAJ5089862.1 hypothetical protein N7532_008546 [Penicillium argentinense]
MPNNTSSPVKRPGLGRRAVSSHAVVTRTSSGNELSESHTNKAPVHNKPHRAHVVGGHRNHHHHHHRNPSFGKNLSKFKLFQLAPETTGRNHHRKKSAPATPVGSPGKSSGHVRWDGALEDHPKNHSMKRNNSTPVLRRNASAVGKRALITTERPHSSAGKKKTVGFELGDDENDDADWEDTTQSPESTRRNSVAPSNPSLDNTTQVLVDPLTFVKRPYPQIPRATSLPDSITNKFVRDNPDPEEYEDEEDQDNKQELDQSTDQGDIANRLLSPSHSARAPPAMSSISAMAKPSAADVSSRSASVNLAGQECTRRTFSTSNLGLANIPGSQPQATSSSMEGGVSRFIVSNKNANQASFSRTDSDPNTPSSFLPHYHPQTPPSPNRGAGKAAASPARPLGSDLPSRTQQKLWLQRTATLNDSPPDNHGVPKSATSSTMDPAFNAVSQARPGTVTFDTSRNMNGGVRTGASGHDTESRHTRKAYEKVSLELTVVRRFQSPTGDSFNRLRALARASKARVISEEPASAMGKPVKSAPSLPLLQHGKHPSRLGSSSESKSQVPDQHSSTSEDLATQSESTDAIQAAKSSHPSHRILSTSDDATHGLTGDQDPEDYPPVNQTDMMIRRMWESREVATSG